MAYRLKEFAELHFMRALNALILLGCLAAIVAATLWVGVPMQTSGSIRAGVTFSSVYAQELGINWRNTLAASLDDLGVRYFRIPVYWKVVQPEENRFDWATIDYQMDEIAMREGKVLLAIGAKLPRWPECWIPDWATYKGPAGERAARLAYMEQAVRRYKDHPALAAWQVENEALFPFGLCPKPNRSFLKREIEFVRSLDIAHPIVTTDSGELSTWFSVAPLPDKLGFSVYRVVRTYGGFVWHYTFIPPYWYARRALYVSPFVSEIFVSEFQMEPWSDDSLTVTPLTEQFRTFDADQMRKNFDYAERMRIHEIYFWGVEWWWWMKTTQQDDRFWKTAKTFFERHAP
ncbi:beta-galactosidase [Patescibacteria group bacterium]|nr:beta-galactosidase [Patescibacteria group bacterium]MDL1953110.1 hypothetical protein [Candidatus Uhrbacteria bacterium UHB]RIL00436.1 MAG: hypothetical protein DCC77_02620 [Candidatus Uhrbacteria bacterium]